MGQNAQVQNGRRQQFVSREQRSRARLFGVALASATLMIAAKSQADVVAYWSLNTLNPLGSPTIAADLGKGSMDATGLGLDAQVYQGTTLSAQSGFIAGTSLGLSGVSANGSWLDVAVDTMGFTDLSIGFATRRSTTGFANVTLQYWRGDVWSDVMMFSPNALNWESRAIDLSTFDSLENGIALLRFTFDGATGSTGSVRLDNVSIMGSVVPAPAALSLFACFVARSTRRRSTT
ncbi:MAG: hypothetical protein EXS10_06435 [Phycisphaerales bacterium]|nr:hypothetical protein [Phycisphaerales bacterium]